MDGRTEMFRADDGRTNGIFFGRSAGRTKIFRNLLRAGRTKTGCRPDSRTPGRPDIRTAERTDGRKKKRKNQSVSQTIDLIMTIKTSTGSSKTELSSRGKRPFKVRRSGANYGPCPSANFKHFDFCLMLEVSKLQASRMQNA